MKDLAPAVQSRLKSQIAATRARRPAGPGGKDYAASLRIRRGIERSRKLAAEFIELCRRRGIPVPVTEYQFDGERRWRFDLAWPEQLVAVEIDGGAFLGGGGGGHNRGAAMRRDQEKLNQAAAQGWRVLRFFPERVLGPGALELVERALK